MKGFQSRGSRKTGSTCSNARSAAVAGGPRRGRALDEQHPVLPTQPEPNLWRSLAAVVSTVGKAPRPRLTPAARQVRRAEASSTRVLCRATPLWRGYKGQNSELFEGAVPALTPATIVSCERAALEEFAGGDR